MNEQLIGETTNGPRRVILDKEGSVEINFNNYIDPSSIPDEHANLRQFNVVAKIDLGPADKPEKVQSMYLVDSRGMLDVESDLLLVDQRFDKDFFDRRKNRADTNVDLGFKGIYGGDVIKVGRSHDTDKNDRRFNYNDHVSRDHFEIIYDGNKLIIKNTNPTHDTAVTSNFIAIHNTQPDPNMTTETDPIAEQRLQDSLGKIALEEQARVKNLSKETLTNAKIGFIYEAKSDKPNEDSYIIDPDKNLYGVFDGLGGAVAGEDASRIASETIQKIMNESPESNSSDPQKQSEILKNAFGEAHKNIMAFNAENKIESATTGTVAKIIKREDGSQVMVWGSVGDTRLYLRNADGKLNPISKDEGINHIIYNYMGGDNRYNPKQFGILEIPKGSQIILMTDGICGDFSEDIPERKIKKSLVTDEEFNQALEGVNTHQEVADKLRRVSLKIDDKTVIVIGDLDPPKRSRMGRIFSRR